MSSRDYTQIPPRSSGDRVQMKFSAEVGFESQTGPDPITGDTVLFVTSGFSGTIARVLKETATTGKLLIVPDRATISDPTVVTTAAEQIRVEGVNFANATGYYEEIYTNTYELVSAQNPTYGQIVDQNGAARVTFKDGDPSVDAFGRLRVADATVLGDYIFAHSTLPQYFTSNLVGGGTVTHEFTTQSLVLSTTTANGDASTHTSNVYHHYLPGISSTIMMTVACGDTGKANLVREWGYFDDNNGVFFRQDSNGFHVVVRSDVSGSVVDIVVDQADFNLDKVDGSASVENLSFMNLDTSQLNVYWVDFQWLGGGRVRFGVVAPDGERITLHESEHANLNPTAYMRTACLPIRLHQYNTGAVGSSSEMRCWCATFQYDSSVNISQLGEARGVTLRRTLSASASPTPTEFLVGSIRAKDLFQGQENTSVAVLTSFQMGVYDTVTKQPVPGILKIFQNSITTGGTWSSSSLSILEQNTTSTSVFQGIKSAGTITSGVYQSELLENVVNYTSGSVKRSPYGDLIENTFWFEPLFPIANDIEIAVSAVFKEYVN